MSRSRTIAVGLAVGTMLAMSVVGCARAVPGTPRAASTPVTAPSGSSGSGSANADKFCGDIKPSMVQQAFGVAGAQVTTGKEQDGPNVTAVSCTVTALNGGSPLAISVLGFDYAAVNGTTVQTVLQNAQTQLAKAGQATGVQPLSGIGDADGAFYCTITTQDGTPGSAVFAAKQLQDGVAATDVTVIGQVQQSQVIAFAKLVDSD